MLGWLLILVPVALGVHRFFPASASLAALIEEDLLRLSCDTARHRYFFGLVKPGGIACDLSVDQSGHLAQAVLRIAKRLDDLHRMLRYSSSFLDRLEEVGIITAEQAASYGLVGPIARASGAGRDIRKMFPYAAYEDVEFTVPVEMQGDGYARLRVFFQEAHPRPEVRRYHNPVACCRLPD
jgi:formate hydrogenlyase subunit 5